MTESAEALEESDWDAFTRYGIFCARWQGMLLYPAEPYMINLDVKLLTPGLQLWLDATDPLANGTILPNGTPVTTWYDKSGNLNNATGGVSPFYANSSIVFTGASFLDTTLTAKPMYETVFVVFILAAQVAGSFNMIGTNSQAGRGLRVFNNSLGYNVSGVNGYSNTNGGILKERTTLASGTISAGPDNGVGTTFINGGIYISQSQVFTTYGEGTTRIGAGNGSDFFNGTISEVLIYNRALSTSERQRVEGYLAWKWRLNGSLPLNHQYYDSFDVVVKEIAALTNLPSFITSINQTNTTTSQFTINWSGGNNTTYYTYTVNGIEVLPLIDQGVLSGFARFGGFTPGTVHSIIIIAYNSAGSRSSATFQAGTAPSQPASIVQTNASLSGFTINWSPVIGATSYRFTLNGISRTPVSSTSTSAVFNGLEGGTGYTVIVTAVNIYASNSSAPFSGTTRPTQPTSLNMSNASETGFTISWSGGQGASSYTYTLNGIAVTPVSSTSSSATFSGLSPGTFYSVIVSANNSIVPLDSNVSATFTATTTPSRPVSLVASNILINGFTISWTGGVGATSYRYTMNGSPITPSNDQGLLNKYVVFTGLPEGTVRVVVVSAVNISGSTSSAPLSVTTPPTVPFSLVITNPNSSGFQINWSGGVGAASYSYQLNGKTVTPSNDMGLTDKYAVFTGLAAGITYNVTVIASNVGGFSMSASIISSISGLQLWLDSANPLGTGVLPSSESVLPTWYDLSINVYNATGVNSPLYTSSGIRFNGTSQYYRTNYTSSASAESIFVVYKLDISGNMALVDTSNNGGRSFQSHPSNGPSLAKSSVSPLLYGLYPTITNTTYIGECLYNSSGISTYVNGNVSSTNLVNPGFSAGTTYIGAGNDTYPAVGYYLNGRISEVIIFNSVLSKADRQKVEGYLAWKWDLQTSLPQSHPYYNTGPTGSVFTSTGPSKPSSLTLTNGSNTGFRINWTGGNGATSYTYTINGSPLTPSIDLGLSDKNITVSGLTGGTSYQIVVTASNSNGSVSSASFTAITAPSKPRTLTVSNVTVDGFTVSWLGGNGAISYSYTLNGSPITPSSDQGLTSNTATFSGISSTAGYNLVITATNSSGSITSASQFDPTTIPGVQTWLDGTDPLNTGASGTNGTSLTTWYDKSGKGNNMTFSGTSITYANNSVNSLNTIFANGTTSAILSIPVNTFTSNYCGFIVFRNGASRPVSMFDRRSGPQGVPFLQDSGGMYRVGTTGLGTPTEGLTASVGTSLLEVLLTTYAATGGTGEFNSYINGAPITFSGGSVTGLNAVDTPENRISFSGPGLQSRNITTDYCEIIMYNSNISTGDRQKIEGYLAWKWGLQNKPLYSPSTYLYLTETSSDTGGNAQTVTNNNVVFGRNIYKNSAKFNNSTSTYLTMPFPYGTGSFTISYWFQTNDNQTYNPWGLSSTATGAGGTDGINPYIYNGLQHCNLVFSDGILSIPSFSYPEKSGVWYHFALTVNINTGFCQLYSNGVTKTSGTGTGTLNNSAYLIIGKAGDSSRGFNGAINNFAVYNSALSSSQISDIYSSQSVTNSLGSAHPYYASEPVVGLKVATLPVTPSSFSLTNVTANEFTINWTVGTGASNYTFTLNTVSTVPSLLTPNSATFNGLSPGTAYSIVVTAVNTEGATVNSAAYAAGTAPSKPISLVISNVTSTGFKVAWSGGVGATSYSYSLNGSATTPSDDQGLASKYAIFSGLSGNTTYTIFITAINALGTSTSTTSISPSIVPGIQLWLDGNDPLNTETPGPNNTSLVTWYDKSGNSRNLSWSGSSITYSNSSINSLNTILIDGTVQGTVSIPTGTFSSNYCGFIVLKTTRASGTIFGRTDTNGWGIFDYLNQIYTATAVGNRTLIADSERAVNGRFIGYPILMNFGLRNYAATGNTGVYNQYYSGLPVPLSGGQTTGLNVSDTISSNIYFGGRAGVSVNHKVNYCEILLFNSNISTTDRQKLEGYLAWKWGLQSVRPYVAQTLLLLNENITDTGSIPQTIINSGVSVVTLITNPSEKNSANFTGTNYLSLPFNYGTGSFSITYWTYRTNTDAMTAWSLSSSATGSGAAGINAVSTNGAQHFYLTFTGETVNAGNWSTPAGFAVWYHSILTVNSATGECNSYLNGVLKNTITAVGTLQNTGNLLLGRNGTNTQGFNGYITNFAVYDYAITQSQVTRIYNSESIVNLLPSSHPYYSSPPISLVSVATLPPRPSALNLTNVTTTGFTVNWSGTGVSNTFTYTLNGVNTVPDSSTSTSATFTGLTPGTSYTIIVNAVNATGGSSASESFAGSTLPSQPTTLSSSSISSTGFTVSWTGGLSATSYTYTLNGTSVVPSNDQGLVSRTATFTGLSGGTTYAVIVTATNAFGSTLSNSFNVITRPGQPTSLNATNITSDSFVVNWSGANGATSYTYTLDGTTRVPASSTSTSATFTGLLAGTSYAVIVNAVNTSGSTASSSLSVLTLPSVPFNLSQTAGSLTAITVSWVGGIGATSYSYTLNGTSTTASDDQGVSSKYATFTGLSSGTIYSIIVTAINSSGSISSPPTVENISGLYLWIDGNDPLGSGTPPANNSTLSTLYDKSGNSRNLSVTNPATPATFSLNSVNGLSNLLFANSVYRSAPLTGTVLFPFDVYLVLKLNSVTAATSICSVCQSNSASSYNALTFSSSKWSNSSESSSRTPATVASSTETSTSYILIQWSFGNSNFNIYRNGSQIAYTSSYSWVPPASLSFLLGLSVDTTTTGNFNGAIAEIVAYNTLQSTTNRQYIEGALAWKWGIQSSLPNIHPYYSSRPTGLNTYTAPPAPTSLTQTNGSMTGFTINWTGASGATRFTYTLDGVSKLPVSSTGSSATFSGLTAGTSYSVIVNAFNGPIAKTLSATFTAVTSPSSPNTLVSSNLTSTGFTVSWLGGLGATSYIYIINGSATTAYVDDGVATKSATFSDLAPGTTYEVLITAVNSSGSTAGGNQLNPSKINILQNWYDAADPLATGATPTNGTTITTWFDKSGNARNSTSVGGNAITKNNDGYNFLNFTTSYYIVPSMTWMVSSGFTLFMVETSSFTAGVDMDYFGNTAGYMDGAPTFYSGNPLNQFFGTINGQFAQITTPTPGLLTGVTRVWSLVFNNSTNICTAYLNGILMGTSVTTTAPTMGINMIGGIGNPFVRYYIGKMREFISFSGNMTTTNRETMEGYLAWKWGIQATLPLVHPFYSGAPLGPLSIIMPPGIPTALTSSEITAISFKLSWSGGTGATSYTYTLNGVTTVPSTNAGVASKYAIFTSLTGGSTYTVIVTSVFSGLTTASSPITILTTPSAANTFVTSSLTSTGFTLSWLGGLSATSYNYTLNGSSVTPAVDNGMTSRSVTFANLSPGTAYTVVVNAVNASGTTAGENQLTPYSVLNLSLWLDGVDPNATGVAPALNSTVTSWKDKTLNNNHYTASGATYAYDSVSGKNAILFSGSSSGAIQTNSNLTLFNDTNRWTIFTAHRGTDSSSNRQTMWRERDKLYWVRWFNGSANIRMTTEYSIVSTYDQLSGVNCLVGEGSTSKYSLNGTMNSYASSDTLVSSSRISVASQYTGVHNENLYGYMNEVLVFNTNLSDLDRQKMEGYLAWKWNTQAKLPVTHPYFSATSSMPLIIDVPPSPITDLASSETTSTSFKLSWLGGTGSTSYTYTLNGVTTVPSTENGVASKNAIFTDLSAGQTYTVIVTGIYSVFTVLSSSLSVTTKPSPTRSLRSSAISSTGFTVSWLGGTGATSYIYKVNGSSVTPSVDNGVTSKTATFTNLEPATIYDVLIDAVNVAGTTLCGNQYISSANTLQNWYDAADPLNTGTTPANGTTITQWFDKSGNSRNTTNSGTTTGGSAVTQQTDTYPYLNFNASFFDIPQMTWMYNNNFSFFIAETVTASSLPTNTLVYRVILGPSGWGDTTGSLGVLYQSQLLTDQKQRIRFGPFLPGASTLAEYIPPGGFSANTTRIWSFTFTSPNNTLSIYLNGTQVGTTLNNPSLMTVQAINQIGKAAGINSAYIGRMREILAYRGSVETSDRQKSEGSLAWKWGQQASLPLDHPYYSTPPLAPLSIIMPPTPITAMASSEITSSSFKVAWSGGNGATTYTYTLDTVTTVPFTNEGVVNKYAIFTGLSLGRTYAVVITGANSVGTTVSSSFNVLMPPAKPTSLVFSSVTSTGFRITWSGAVGATSYIYTLNGVTVTPSNDQGLASKYAIFSGLVPNTGYEVIVIAVNSSGNTSSVLPVSPSSIAGLQSWLDGNDPLNTGAAATNNSSLTNWVDKSGNSRNMAFTGSSITYANSSINSLNTIHVNGTALGTISIPTGTFPSNYCGFIVLKSYTKEFGTIFGRTDTNGWGVYDNYGTEVYTATAVGNRTYVGRAESILSKYIGFPMMMNFGLRNYATTGGTGTFSAHYNGIPVQYTGGQITGLNASDTISSNIYFGQRAGNLYDHQINYCEVLIFNSNIGTVERQKLEGYLAWKWGLQSVRPYTAQTILLFNENLLDTGAIPQTLTNSGVSVIGLVTNPSRKSSASFTLGNYLRLPFNYGTGSFSITSWTYYSTTGSMTAWSLSSTASGVSGAAGINASASNGTQNFNLAFSGGTVNAGNWTAPATSAVWYHSILTVNSATGECKSYLNGVLKTTVTGVGTLQNTGNLLLGTNATNTEGFTGYLNNFAVYNYVLSQAQITVIYNSESVVNLLPSSHPYYSSPPLSGVSTVTSPT